jgi:serine/threonine protein phosphatase PrpC
MLDQQRNQPEVQEDEVDPFADTKPEAVPEQTVIAAEQEKRGRPGLHAAQVSDVGAIRKRNEDSCLVFSSQSGGHFPLSPFGLYVVADGMGGHEAGHQASKAASRAATHHLLKTVCLPLLEDAHAPDHEALMQITEDAVRAAHQAVYNPDPARDGGTTLTFALVLGQELYIGHVGDSRAYSLIDGKLQTITSDHSLVQRLQDEGQLTAEEAEAYEFRNVLLRALGQEDELEVDTYHCTLPQNGKLLLCSDGLCGLVKDAELERIMNLSLPPQETADQLIAAALKAGGYDNITAVVVEFSY